MSFLKSMGARKKERLMLAVAIALGLLAGGANWVYLRKMEKTKITVLKAKKSIPAASQVDGSQFEEVEIAGDVTKMKSIFITKEDFGAFRKATLAESLQPGQLLTLRSFYLDKDSIARPPAGKRSISIKVYDEANAVGYSIRPGHAVDIWGFINGRSALLKKGACVTAVGDKYLAPNKGTNGDDNYKSVTVLVDEKDVECLTTSLWTAERKTTITLAGDCNTRQSLPAACLGPAPGSAAAAR
ncbi:MAG TPA: hypothetical protein VJ302_13310 [Blastocatellia bacterium]|nr:hypothetical protein [Blastocatellia bacterium]